MRKAFRVWNNAAYWDQRWSEAEKDEDYFKNIDIYPIKYAEMVKPNKNGIMAELGCGLGRVVKHYHRAGLKIIGIERSNIAVEKMKRDNHRLLCLQGDVLILPFCNDAFDTVLAFGLYHNFENNWQEAINETVRCIKKGGKYVISIRPDNFEMRFNEFYWKLKQRKHKVRPGKKYFHKSLFGEDEFRKILENSGLKVENIYRAKNVSMFWRLPFLREKNRRLSEGHMRSNGYRLNHAGNFIDQLVSKWFPASFCNVLVYVGEKFK